MVDTSSFLPITEDSGVLKKILTPSPSDQLPQQGQKVEGKLLIPH